MEENLERLSLLYNQKLREIVSITKEISTALREYYTDEKMKTFKTKEEFNDDVNSICENGGTGKHIFITLMQKKYFK